MRRSQRGLPSSRRVSSRMPRPEDPGRSPHPHQGGCFVLASCSLTHSPPATSRFRGCTSTSGFAVTPVAYAILCVRFVCLVRLLRSVPATPALRRTRNTRYGWVVSPYPTGTSTRQDAPSFAWRDNDCAQARRYRRASGRRPPTSYPASVGAPCSAALAPYFSPSASMSAKSFARPDARLLTMNSHLPMKFTAVSPSVARTR